MRNRCEIPNCSVEPGEEQFSLPSDPIIRKKWILALCNVYPNPHLRKNVFICEKHFKSTDFTCVITDDSGKIIQQVKTKKKHLKQGAIPHFIDSQSHVVSNTTDMITDSFRLIAASKTEASTRDVTETGGIIQISTVKEKCLEPKRNISDVESGEIIQQDPAPKRRCLQHEVNTTNNSASSIRILSIKNEPESSASDLLASDHSSLIENSRTMTKKDRWANCDSCFNRMFIQNEFGLVCDVCNRLWSATDLKVVTAQQADVLASAFPTEAENDSLKMFRVNDIININAQSLSAHGGDISTDTVLQRADYLVCSKTWLRDSETPTNIIGFTCESRRNECTNTDRRLAGGVAIYKSIESVTTCEPLSFDFQENSHLQSNLIGDFTSIKVLVNKNTQFILAAIYIHPGITIEKILMFLFQSLLPYTNSLKKLLPNIEPDTKTPIILCGNFNNDISRNQTLSKFMKDEFNLKLCQTPPMTLGNTVLDLTFIRNIDINILRYISYFSYHRPILNKLMLKN